MQLVPLLRGDDRASGRRLRGLRVVQDADVLWVEHEGGPCHQPHLSFMDSAVGVRGVLLRHRRWGPSQSRR